MKFLLTLGTAGLMAASLPAVGMAQSTPQTNPPQQTTHPTQNQNQNRTQRQNSQNPMQQQRRMQNNHQRMRNNQNRNNGNSNKAQQEIATAHAHAMMAERAQSLDTAHKHLHHVINCLEGKSGSNYDSKVGNPCKGQGNGALHDTDNQQSMHRQLQMALNHAKSGVKADKLKQAQQDARKAASELQAKGMQGGMNQQNGMH